MAKASPLYEKRTLLDSLIFIVICVKLEKLEGKTKELFAFY